MRVERWWNLLHNWSTSFSSHYFAFDHIAFESRFWKKQWNNDVNIVKYIDHNKTISADFWSLKFLAFCVDLFCLVLFCNALFINSTHLFFFALSDRFLNNHSYFFLIAFSSGFLFSDFSSVFLLFFFFFLTGVSFFLDGY